MIPIPDQDIREALRASLRFRIFISNLWYGEWKMSELGLKPGTQFADSATHEIAAQRLQKVLGPYEIEERGAVFHPWNFPWQNRTHLLEKGQDCGIGHSGNAYPTSSVKEHSYPSGV